MVAMKKSLQNVRVYTYGLLSYPYLFTLWEIIKILHVWENWKGVMCQGSRYLIIRNSKPEVESRRYTCEVLSWMLDACLKRKKKGWLGRVCGAIVSFTHSTLHSYIDWELVLKCIESCLRLEKWKAGTPVLFKLMQANIKCKLIPLHVGLLILYSYVILLMNLTRQPVI
jgi:hypothetical protein